MSRSSASNWQLVHQLPVQCRGMLFWHHCCLPSYESPIDAVITALQVKHHQYVDDLPLYVQLTAAELSCMTDGVDGIMCGFPENDLLLNPL
jgi:hypothetical protein